MLVDPADAVATVRRALERRWAHAVCAEHGVGESFSVSVPLRPGVSSGKAVERLGHATWHAWHMRWRALAERLPDGVTVVRKPVAVAGLVGEYPATLVADVDGAAALVLGLGAEPLTVDLDRGRAIASALGTADAIVTPATVRATCRLRDADVAVLLAVATWLRAHPDVSTWTRRQLPVPGMHTKWLDAHGALVRDVTGRDIRSEVRPRPAVMHLTYVDPGHAASNRRRHDAWTSGDVHDLAYEPRVVLVVENRDCRLWFPPVEHAIVVEGGGKAAAALLAQVPWIRAADHVVYWGDMDADGYAILDLFRAALAEPSADGIGPTHVMSMFMDIVDLHRYAKHGVNHDRFGRPLEPSSAVLPHLTGPEAAAYDEVATAGPARFRRIEQEIVPLLDAANRLRAVARRSSDGSDAS